jgi:hypothetical protein
MGEIINLAKARKLRERAEAKRQASENRAAFGRSKAERQAADKKRQTDSAHLDGHRREPSDED